MKVKHRAGRVLAVTLTLALSACASDAVPATTMLPTIIPPTTTPPTTVDGQSHQIQDIWTLPGLEPVDPGTYFMDPDIDDSTPLRVVYEISADGWSQWAGAVKFGDKGHVGMSITTVNNLVVDGCTDHFHADPPIGPTVDDLATALTELAPFQVTVAPSDVMAYGYSGQHLEWTVPDNLRFTECTGGQLMSWVAPWDTTDGDAFYGYTGPAYEEEFWILDVEGTRLMIAAERSVDSPQQDLDELVAILDSIRIEP